MGTYWVEVTTEYGCTASDTVHLELYPSPYVNLGNDTLICEDGTLELNPNDTDGVAWYWNTGETSNTILVDNDGTYSVLVTNSFGCMASDTIDVNVDGYFPTMDGITVDNLSPLTFKFTPFNPEFITSYQWDFGDGSPYSLAFSPTHTYDTPGTYLVKCFVTSSCGTGFFETFATIFTGIEDMDFAKDNLKLYPNPTRNIINLETLNGIKMESLSVINVLGQDVKNISLDNVTEYILDVNGLSAGSYFLRIKSDKGDMIKKFQIVR